MQSLDSYSTRLIAIQGARALARLLLDNGKFIYRFKAGIEPRLGSKYNVLRHCGSAWSMLDVARQAGNLPEVVAAGEKAIQHMIDHYLSPYGADALCVVDGGKIKLGGNGLALLALVELNVLCNDAKYLQLGHRLASYIAAEQRPDGDFVHSRSYQTSEERGFRSEYYTGEALFGLVRLYEATADKQWLDLAINSEQKLFTRDYGIHAQSHWMLYTLEHLYTATGSIAFLEHAHRIAEHIVLFPDYRETRRSTPIACRSEGLLAYARMRLKAPHFPRKPSIKDCLSEVRKNLTLQLAFKTPTGEFIRGDGSSEIRIDYIQHNISAFMAYSKILEARRRMH